MPDELALHKSMSGVLDRAEQVADPDGTAEDDSPLSIELPADRARTFTNTSFTRMRTVWPKEDQAQLDQLRYLARVEIQRVFPAAFTLRDEIWMTVREALLDGGEIIRDQHGRVQWVLDDDGKPVENWEQLGDERRRHFLHVITTHLMEWDMSTQELWLPAMIAKAQWEESFARGFMAMPGYAVEGKPTIEDRTHAGHLNSIDFRYFAIYQSYLSRMGESLVRSMVRIQVMLEKTYIR